MKIVIDSHIPYLRGVLEPYAEVQYCEPLAITAAVVRDADALVVRTRTRCDAALLEGSRVQLIVTATIGFDHIDTAYCAARGIQWTNCPGCNAQGVCDYVESALLETGRLQTSSEGLTLGIVGVGHVGRLVEQMAVRRGLRVVLCDPLRALHEPCSELGHPFEGKDEVARRADVVTFHTPLTKEGEHATWHLADAAFFASCKRNALIINAARGGVVDEEALLASGLECVLDCWEGEPTLRKEMLDRAGLASMHIAGYTRLGKYRASEMAVEALNKHFGWAARMLEPNTFPERQVFSVRAISEQLKAAPERFEELREKYVLR